MTDVRRTPIGEEWNKAGRLRNQQDTALRELLAYCEAETKTAHGGAWDAYDDMAERLAGILGAARD